MNSQKIGQYYVGCKTASNEWIPVTAKTLIGAKRQASSIFGSGVGSILQVGQLVRYVDSEHIDEVATKHGFDAWQGA